LNKRVFFSNCMGTITLSMISIDEKINKLGKLFYRL